jgi:hypothetical protein
VPWPSALPILNEPILREAELSLINTTFSDPPPKIVVGDWVNLQAAPFVQKLRTMISYLDIAFGNMPTTPSEHEQPFVCPEEASFPPSCHLLWLDECTWSLDDVKGQANQRVLREIIKSIFTEVEAVHFDQLLIQHGFFEFCLSSAVPLIVGDLKESRERRCWKHRDGML